MAMEIEHSSLLVVTFFKNPFKLYFLLRIDIFKENNLSTNIFISCQIVFVFSFVCFFLTVKKICNPSVFF